MYVYTYIYIYIQTYITNNNHILRTPCRVGLNVHVEPAQGAQYNSSD